MGYTCVQTQCKVYSNQIQNILTFADMTVPFISVVTFTGVWSYGVVTRGINRFLVACMWTCHTFIYIWKKNHGVDVVQGM